MKKRIITTASIAVFIALFAVLGHVSTITASNNYANIDVKNITVFTLKDVTISANDQVFYYRDQLTNNDSVTADCIPSDVNFVTVAATVHNQYVQIPVYNVQYLLNTQHQLVIRFTVDEFGKVEIETNEPTYNY